MRLWNRTYRLQVDTLEITDLEVAFSIERTLRRRPGRCEVKIWNLSQDHRRQLERLRPGHVFVEFHAGFDGENSLLLRGELYRADSVWSATDVITTIRSRDGGVAQSARVSRSHRPGASWGTVVRDVVNAMGIGSGNLGDFLSSTMSGVGNFAGGATVTGSAGDALDRMMRSADLEWSIQNGALQVLRRGDGLRREAVRLAPGTGLIGSPARTEKNKMKVAAKLIPGLVPGALVRLESADHQGTFRIEAAIYKGESRGKDWGVELTCGEPTSAARRAA